VEALQVIRVDVSNIWLDGKLVSIDQDWNNRFEKTLIRLAQNGNRIIACAIFQLPGNKFPDNFIFSSEKVNYPQSGYTFLGLLALEDPPKEGVKEAITKIKAAGIKVLMITGDNPVTAESVSRKVSLITNDDVIHITSVDQLPISLPQDGKSISLSGSVIKHLSDLDWVHILNYDEIIFARTLPAHKLEIVKRAQSLGHIVAVTGDGVNDSSALKRADLGIAMNKTGSDISKDSARMILLDDNFASTCRGIQEGLLIHKSRSINIYQS
jgi:sodium/potassium-transporting ATPase subunit alpha